MATETKEQRAAGIAQVNKNQAAAAKLGVKLPGSSGVNDGSGVEDPMLETIRENLMGKANLISSSDSGLEDAINNAVASSKQSRTASESRIRTDYKSDKDYMLGQAESGLTDFSESRNGFGTQLASLRNLVETTDKNLRDLDQRREDALMANDAASANRISELQLKAIEFKEQKMQQGYDNMFKLANFDLQVNAQKTSAEQFQFELGLKRDDAVFRREQLTSQEEQTMAALAVEFGEELLPTDDLQSLTKRIAPKADAKRKKELELLNAQISSANSKADKEDKSLVYDDLLVTAYGQNKDPEVMSQYVLAQMRKAGQGVTPTEYNAIKIRAKEISDKMAKDTARNVAEQTPSVWERFFGGSTTGQNAYGRSYGVGVTDRNSTVPQPKTLEELQAENLGYYQGK